MTKAILVCACGAELREDEAKEHIDFMRLAHFIHKGTLRDSPLHALLPHKTPVSS